MVDFSLIPFQYCLNIVFHRISANDKMHITKINGDSGKCLWKLPLMISTVFQVLPCIVSSVLITPRYFTAIAKHLMHYKIGSHINGVRHAIIDPLLLHSLNIVLSMRSWYLIHLQFLAQPIFSCDTTSFLHNACTMTIRLFLSIISTRGK